MCRISAIGTFNVKKYQPSKKKKKKPISAEPQQIHTHIHTHTPTHPTHNMNKSHTLVGLSCSSLFSLLSQAAASPSSLQTPWIQQQQLSSYPVWFQMVWVWISVNLYPKGTRTVCGASQQTNENISLDIFWVNVIESQCIFVWKATSKVPIPPWFKAKYKQ